MIYVIDYEDYDFFFAPLRHSECSEESLAKRYIVIASREERTAWQSRKASRPLNPPQWDF